MKYRSVQLPPSPYSFPTSNQYPAWHEILRREWRVWTRALAKAKKGPHVLVATSFGIHSPSAIVESALAVALTLRGARVHLLLCDHALAACQIALSADYADTAEFVQNGPARYCELCFPPANQVYESLGLPVHRYSEFLAPATTRRINEIIASVAPDEIPQFTFGGLPVGEHAQAGALRFYARGDLNEQEGHAQVQQRYLRAALQTTFAAQALVAAHPFKSVCLNHGIYVPQGLIAHVARAKKMDVVTWAAGYRKRRFLFSHHETYHHALMTEPTANWEAMTWTPEVEAAAREYLASRWHGTRDWIWFHEKPEHELDAIARELGIDFKRPTIGVLTNVMWDAQLHYPANAFPNMRDWLMRTIQYFTARPDLQLLIRVHPAEIRGTVPSRQRVRAEIESEFPDLAKNIFLIPPESNVSTYAAMVACNAVLIYGTKTGVELTSIGVPVIVAGEAWIRNKGITMDAHSADEYFQFLDRLPLPTRLDAATQRRALMYAYHFFFRRMIPLEMFEPQTGWPPYQLNINSLAELAPGASRGLDLVCDGILKGSEFIYPAEEYNDHSD